MCKCFLIIKVMYVYFVGFMPLRQAVYEWSAVAACHVFVKFHTQLVLDLVVKLLTSMQLYLSLHTIFMKATLIPPVLKVMFCVIRNTLLKILPPWTLNCIARKQSNSCALDWNV